MNEREFLIRLSVMKAPYLLQLACAGFIRENGRIPAAVELARLTGRSEAELAVTFERAQDRRTGELYRRNTEFGRVLTILDGTYPERLSEIYHPPVVLYCQGDMSLLAADSLGIVGARRHTPYAEKCLEMLLPDVLKAGIVTVSGLAGGVDSIVHEMTLRKHGRTVAVIGTGLDVTYPRGNVMLQSEVAGKGLVVTEYPLGEQPLKFHFPQRNRIIAGLIQTILVVEARHRSGTLITANLALQENRNVLAVPGRIDEPLSQGTNELISAGAKPVLRAEDIIEEFSNCLTNRIQVI